MIRSEGVSRKDCLERTTGRGSANSKPTIFGSLSDDRRGCWTELYERDTMVSMAKIRGERGKADGVESHEPDETTSWHM